MLRAYERHGQTAGGRTPTYLTWFNMLQRCQNPKNKRFKDYGAKGVTVCEKWKTLGGFIADMGERPEGKTIDRHPNKLGNYEPGNCRWATPKQQGANRSTTKLGHRELHQVRWLREMEYGIRQIARMFQVNHSTVRNALREVTQ